MEGFQEKVEGSKPEAAGAKKKRRFNGPKKQNEPKQQDEANIPELSIESDEKKKERHFQRSKRIAEDEGKAGAPADDGPITFNAHALDLDPGTIIPERPSIDLTYNDFTRESYEAADNRPFVPKRKKAVPFELSETPRMQADHWEGRAPGRRKLLNAMEDTAQQDASKSVAENETDKKENQQQKQENKGKTAGNAKRQERQPAKTGAKRQTRPPVKGGAPRQEHTKAQERSNEAKTDSPPEEAPKEAPKEKKTGFLSLKARRPKSSGEAVADKQAKQKTDPGKVSQESGKESLMRPYWLKK